MARRTKPICMREQEIELIFTHSHTGSSTTQKFIFKIQMFQHATLLKVMYRKEYDTCFKNYTEAIQVYVLLRYPGSVFRQVIEMVSKSLCKTLLYSCILWCQNRKTSASLNLKANYLACPARSH